MIRSQSRWSAQSASTSSPDGPAASLTVSRSTTPRGGALHRMPDAMVAHTAYFDAFFADARRRERANVFGGDPYVLDADGARRKDEFGADGC